MSFKPVSYLHIITGLQALEFRWMYSKLHNLIITDDVAKILAVAAKHLCGYSKQNLGYAKFSHL